MAWLTNDSEDYGLEDLMCDLTEEDLAACDPRLLDAVFRGMNYLAPDSEYYGLAQDLMYDLAKDDAGWREPRSLREVGNELKHEFAGEYRGITSSALVSLYEEYMKWYNEFKDSEGD